MCFSLGSLNFDVISVGVLTVPNKIKLSLEAPKEIVMGKMHPLFFSILLNESEVEIRDAFLIIYYICTYIEKLMV